MNPSNFGWIDKFLRDLKESSYLLDLSLDNLYYELKEVGFIYGTSNSIVPSHYFDLEYSQEEQTKINLLSALVITYFDSIKDGDDDNFIDSLMDFYGYLDVKKSFFSFMNPIVGNKSERLEKILHARIQTNESIFKKNFSHLLTNALLFIDVLSYQKFLIHQIDPLPFAVELEATLTNTVFLALNSKEEKTEHDKLLIKLFASSLRYNNIQFKEEPSFGHIHFEQYTDRLIKQYILDLTSLAIWSDERLDESEIDFINTLGAELNLDETIVDQSIESTHTFVDIHKENISFFNYSNPAKHFYNQTSRTVNLLILRNKRRLTKEISESKELMVLLGQSTIRELSHEEKKQVKQQLLDICKTIPSLAIFILPGGSLLLPLLVKFIPQLLPSAFNDNK